MIENRTSQKIEHGIRARPIDRSEDDTVTYLCMQKLSLGKKKEKSCDVHVHVHVRTKVVDFGWNDDDSDDSDGDDELVASIIYLT